MFNRNWQVPRGSVIFNFRNNETDFAIDIPFPINL